MQALGTVLANNFYTILYIICETLIENWIKKRHQFTKKITKKSRVVQTEVATNRGANDAVVSKGGPWRILAPLPHRFTATAELSTFVDTALSRLIREVV